MTKAVCSICKEKPAAAVVEEKEHVCAECLAVNYEPEELQVRWLGKTPERDGLLWLPRSAVAEILGDEIPTVEKEMVKLDYAIVGGTEGPGLTFKRRGELTNREAEAIMTFADPLTEGAGTHVTEALYRWLEDEKP